MSEAEIKAKLEEVDSLLRMLEERKKSLLKALEALKMSIRFENKFEFNPPIPKDSGAFKNFLMPKILNAHKDKHGIQYRILESNGLVSAIEFSKCSDEHRKEIIKACEWVQRDTKAKGG
jgi:hypothetical protein